MTTKENYVPSATHHDADVVLRLYDLRREETMRRARAWMVGDFWPQKIDDVLAITNGSFAQSAYFRQIVSFCEMACSLPLHGAVHPELFTDWCGEILFIFAKFKPLLPEIREKINPSFLGNTEKFIQSSEYVKQKFAATEARARAFGERVMAAKK